MAAETTREILLDLRLKIQENARRWSGYINGMNGAYSQAFHRQELVLRDAKVKIEAMKKAEYDNMVFALSMLTVVAGGPLASYFAKSISGPLKNRAAIDRLASLPADRKLIQSDELIDAAAQKAISFGHDLLKSKPVTDRLEGLAKAPIPSEPYVPAGITPTEYAAALLQGNDERATILAEGPSNWYDHAHMFSPGFTIYLRKAILSSPYFTGAPAAEMTDKTRDMLRRRAKLGLWVAWALERKKRYWEVQTAIAQSYISSKSEIWAWGALRQELLSLGVPSDVISVKWIGPRGIVYGMNMDGFIKWASSTVAVHDLYSGFPGGDEAFKRVKQSWLAKNRLKLPN